MLTWHVWRSASNTEKENGDIVPVYYGEGSCLSTDEKPKENIFNGSRLSELDTSKMYRYDAASQTWRLWSSGGGGGDTPNIASDAEVDEALDRIFPN